MANEVGIRVTSDNDAAPGLAQARSQVKAVGDEATKSTGPTRTFGQAVGTAGKAAKEASTDTQVLTARYHDLTTKMREAEGVVTSLKRRISEGDTSLFGDLDKQQRDLDKLSQTRVKIVEQLKNTGTESAEGFSSTFLFRVGPLMSRGMPSAVAGVAPPLLAVGGGIAAGMAALFGSALAAGVAGGVAGGGIIGGLTIAAKHPAVKAEAEATGKFFGDMMERAAGSFGPAAIQGMRVFRGEIGKAEGDLKGIFDRTSTFVDPLARSVGQAVRRLAQGARALVDESGPVIDMLGNRIPRVADAMADGMEDIADNTESAARALGIVFMIVEGGIRGFFGLVNVLAETYGWMEKLGAVMRGDVGTLWRIAAEDAIPAGEANSEFADALNRVFEEAEDATRAVKSFVEIQHEIVDANLSAAEATLSYRDALAEAKEVFDGKKGANKDEEEALIQLARRSNDLTESLDAAGRTAQEASDHHAQLRRDFVNAAIAAGKTASEAEHLADTYLAIPDHVDTKFNTNKRQAEADIEALNRRANHAGRPRTIHYTVSQSGSLGAVGQRGMASGGIAGALQTAQSGGIRNGLTAVGEFGMELLELPPGTHVNSNADSQRLLAEGGRGSGPMQLIISGNTGGPGINAALLEWFHSSLRTGQLSVGVRAEDGTYTRVEVI